MRGGRGIETQPTAPSAHSQADQVECVSLTLMFPDEACYGAFAANRRPRFEPRAKWPRGSRCARPWALVRGSPGAKLS